MEGIAEIPDYHSYFELFLKVGGLVGKISFQFKRFLDKNKYKTERFF
jgi:hypothetical protein